MKDIHSRLTALRNNGMFGNQVITATLKKAAWVFGWHTSGNGYPDWVRPSIPIRITAVDETGINFTDNFNSRSSGFDGRLGGSTCPCNPGNLDDYLEAVLIDGKPLL